MNSTNKQRYFPWKDRPDNCGEAIWRDSANPIIGRNPIPAALRIYNSAVVPYKDGYVAVLRADYRDGMPHLHLGKSRDGINWQIEHGQIVFESRQGMPGVGAFAYDPRVTRIDDTFYITWCNGYHGPTIGVAYTKDFETFIQLENAFLPFNRNGVLFPKKINGNFAMLSRPSDNGHTPFGDVFYSESPDMCYWGRHRHVLGTTKLWWESTKVGAGAVPIETPEGWLLIYHGVMNTCRGFVYSMGAALLDLEQPWKVLARGNKALMGPETDYEISGHVPNVLFPCAAVHEESSGRIAVYYGAADTTTCLAYTTIKHLTDFIKANS
ncbi:Beta-1,4-mannooligosaccharide phosphorylase [Limihaloglobus sulfuriphilus]|uniref:Beta-1,4-mannooligosaccharide phosphorylase n=1 Tax=Limihaloglobus sulfuriphilus TaxID=1851148 RepID=A0A1Q2MC96_9BACT|nr:glycoside hydrolase family 130 protein [Limihaloglobus sulfuriphilus]AQQ69862.1 Beta-1,4-mannooligosaccharide phosphorylase [Limihaloglobus sulfuriphilus]